MGEATGQILVLAVGVALSPLPIIAVILLLTRPGGRAAGWWFVAGWALALALLGTAVLVVADEANASESGAAASWVGVVQMLLAVLLLGAAASQWRARPGGDEDPESPSWMLKVEAFTSCAGSRSRGAVRGGQAEEPAADDRRRNGDRPDRHGRSAAGGRPRDLRPARLCRAARARCDPAPDGGARGANPRRHAGWMVRENSTIVAVICLVIAVKLLGDGITVLAG